MNGLELWKQVEITDPSQTKQYQGKGGFKGTAIKPIYLIKKATELWGPMGDKWGAKVVSETVFDGAPIIFEKQIIGVEKLHSVRIELYYPRENYLAKIESYGHTLMVGSNKYGPFTDDEAPKKSFTDAIGKALHYLGFSADIYFGSFDGSKYDADQKPESAASSKEVPSDLKEKLTKSIQNATQAKAIEEKIAALTPADTQAAAEILGEIKAMEEPAARERRKKLLSDKVKELGWVVSNANGVDLVLWAYGVEMKAFEHHYWTVECTDCGDPIEGDTEREAVRSARVLGYHEVDGRVVCGDCLETISYGGTND